MRTSFVMICAVLLAGCGVNPDRLATMHERNTDRAERGVRGKTAAGADAPLEAEENDPAPIRDAIASLQALSKLVDAKKYEEYLAQRNDLMQKVAWSASDAVAKSRKAPLIVERVYLLDAKVADAAGGDAKANYAAEGRATTASADARFALREAFGECDIAAEATEDDARAAATAKYESALQRAKSVDPKAMQYVGERVSGGGFVDVPAAYAVCEARLKLAKLEAADRPSAEPSVAKTYKGCGFYPVAVEAKQTGPNKFGQYLLTSAYVADADPGAATPIDCATIPPVSDAESAVQTVVKEFVAWLQPTDVISMAGNFEYSGPEGQTLKKGTARIYRRQATLKTNACGATEANVTCEANGSMLAKAHNHAQHYLKRAEAHKQSGNAARCEAMIDLALKSASVASPEGANLKFAVAGDQQLTRAQIQAKVDELKKKAQAAQTGDWCAAK